MRRFGSGVGRSGSTTLVGYGAAVAARATPGIWPNCSSRSRGGWLQYLWRAVDEDGDAIDVLVQSRRNRRAAVRFFRKLLKGQGCVPRRLITDKIYCDRVMPHSVVPVE